MPGVTVDKSVNFADGANPLPTQKTRTSTTKATKAAKSTKLTRTGKVRQPRTPDVASTVRALIEKYPGEQATVEAIQSITGFSAMQIRQVMRRLVRNVPGVSVVKAGQVWLYAPDAATLNQPAAATAEESEESNPNLRLETYHAVGTLSSGAPIVEDVNGGLFILVPMGRVQTGVGTAVHIHVD